jgi:hypothetical protein
MGKARAPKSTETSNQTQTVTPYAPAQGGLEDMLKAATTAYAATPKTPTFTGPNQTQLDAASMLKNLAPSTAAGAGAMSELANKTSSGFWLDPANNPTMQGSGWHEDLNPALQSAIQAAINPLHDQLDQNILSVGDAAKLAGAYGGDRGDLLKATALSRFNRDAMDVGSNLWYNSYEAMTGRNFQANQGDFAAANAAREAERQRQMNSGALYNDANQLALDPARILSALGDQQSGWDQAAAASAIDAPWAGLDRYATILGQAAPYATTNTTGTATKTGTPGGGGLTGGISGALGGASAGSAFGPWGAGIGAVVGGLGGLFG